MNTGIEAKSKDDVLKLYELTNNNLWSIWVGKQLKFSNVDDNSAIASDKLDKTLDVVQMNGTSTVYTMKFHDTSLIKNEVITDKTPYTSSFCFKLNEYEYVPDKGNDNRVVVVGSPNRNASIPELQQVIELIKSQQEQINTLSQSMAMMQQNQICGNDDPDDDEDEDFEEEDNHVTKVEKITNNIALIASAIQPHVGMIGNILQNIFNPGNNQAPTPGIAGDTTPSENLDMQQRYTNALQLLDQKLGSENLVIALEKLSKKDAATLKNLLNFL